MHLINKRNIVALIVSIIITIAFLRSVFPPPSGFNLSPFVIHDEMYSFGVSENTFIRNFDYCFAVFVLILSYFLARKVFEVYGLLK